MPPRLPVQLQEAVHVDSGECQAELRRVDLGPAAVEVLVAAGPAREPRMGPPPVRAPPPEAVEGGRGAANLCTLARGSTVSTLVENDITKSE